MWNSVRLDNSELPNILLRAVNGKYFSKGTGICKIIGSFLDKDAENLEDHGCPKVLDLDDEKIWTCSSNPFRLQCAERKAKMFGNWILQRLML